jgi:hypothetical protein
MSEGTSHKRILVVIDDRATTLLLRLTALKCAAGLVAVFYIGGVAAFPVGLFAFACISVVVYHWRHQEKAYPLALYFSAVFWMSASILALVDKPFTRYNIFAAIPLLAIGVWDMIASRLQIEDF